VHVEGCDGGGPADAGVVAVLIHDGLQQPGDPDAVAAHPDDLVFTIGVGVGRTHRLGVDGSELEDVTDLDSMALVQVALVAVRAAVSLDRRVEISELAGQGQVLGAEVDVERVVVRAVEAAEEVDHVLDRLVEQDATDILEPQGTREADLRTRRGDDDRSRRRYDAVDVQGVAHLDQVDLQVSSDADRHLEGVGLGVAGEDDGLDHVSCRDAIFTEQRFELLHGLGAGGVLVAPRASIRVVPLPRPPAGGALDVGAVVAGVAGEEDILAYVRERHELGAAGAADCAAVGLDRDESVEADLGEDPPVHRAVHVEAATHAFFIHIEGVGVAHVELAAAQEPAVWAGLVAVLPADLVEVQAVFVQVAPGGNLRSGEPGNDLLRRGGQPVALTAAAGGLEHRAGTHVLVPATRLLPELSGLDDRHLDVENVVVLHLGEDDRLDLAEHAPAQVGQHEDAGSHLPDVASAHQKGMRAGETFCYFTPGPGDDLLHPHGTPPFIESAGYAMGCWEHTSCRS